MAPVDVRDDKAYLGGKNCPRCYLPAEVGKGRGVHVKDSDFPVLLCVALEAEKWKLTHQDLKKRIVLCGQNLFPKIQKARGKGPLITLYAGQSPSNEDLITWQLHGLHEQQEVDFPSLGRNSLATLCFLFMFSYIFVIYKQHNVVVKSRS